MISAITTAEEFEIEHAAPRLHVRKASMRDIPNLLELINSYAAKGIMLARTEFELSENMRDFCVAYSGEKLIGCGALHFYSPLAGEIRSLAVAESAKTRGIGRQIVQFLVEEALDYSLAAVFAFTYVPGFFARVGFQEVERGILPLKVWKDCLRCPKFSNCDEIAVLRVFDQTRWNSAQWPASEENLLIQLPQVRR